MSSKILIVKGTIVYFISNIIDILLGFIFIVIVSRILGKAGYGLLTIGITIRELATNFGMFGMSIFLQKILSGNITSASRRYAGSIFFLNILIALILFIVLFFFSNYLSLTIFNKPDLDIILKIIGLSILFSLPLNFIKFTFKAQKKIKIFLIINLIEKILKIISIAIIFIIEDKIIAISSTLLISSFITFTFGFILLLKEKIIPSFLNLIFNINKIIRFGFIFFIIGICYYFAGQVDKLFLGMFDTSINLGIYSICSSIAIIPSLLQVSMVSIFMPLVSESYKKKEIIDLKNNYFFSNIFICILNTIIIIFIIVFGDMILKIFFNIEEKNVYFILYLLSIRFYLDPFFGPSSALLNMANKHRIELLNSIILVILSIPLNFILIKFNGIFGAIYANLISSLIYNIIQATEIYVFFNFLIFKKEHLFLILQTGLIIIIYLIFFNISIIFRIVYFVITVSIVILTLIFVLNREQRKQIFNIIAKIFNPPV